MAGLDSNTKLLLPCDGADGSTIIPDISITNPKGNATTVGTIQLDTDVKKWGTASLLFDGNSDYISYADDADWDVAGSNADDWTIDFWVKMSDHTGTDALVMQWEDDANRWAIRHKHGTGLRFIVVQGGSGIVNTGEGGEITDNDWHHVALCKVADKYAMYLDGVQTNYTQDSDVDTFAGDLYTGFFPNVGNYLDGYMDEIRIQKSNYFEAAPVVGTSDTIIIPTEAYSQDVPPPGGGRRIFMIT